VAAITVEGCEARGNVHNHIAVYRGGGFAYSIVGKTELFVDVYLVTLVNEDNIEWWRMEGRSRSMINYNVLRWQGFQASYRKRNCDLKLSSHPKVTIAPVVGHHDRLDSDRCCCHLPRKGIP
jgi:hypothetical protein